MSWLVLCVLALSALSPARGMSAAPPGVVETGAPSFVVLGPEALGLSTAPSDLHLLPDGRILIVAQRELTFGDGVRWETFHGTAEQSNLLSQVAVDPNDGAIYVGTFGGISRIELGETARWRFSPVEKFPVGAHEQLAGKVATFPHQWLWFGGGDLVLSWRPGETSRLCGSFGPIDRILSLDQDVYLSDQSVGKLFRLGPDGRSEVVEASALLVSESVTCAVPYAPGQILVGTVSAGLKLFDGRTFRPFGPPGLLNGVRRITDLCAAGENYFAAAVDTVGIVFFDREGRTVQVLERTLDHRLARVLRLRYSESGVLWALLHEGVARVGFPSPVSHFEPLVASGLVYPVPLRHAGQLWILGDGRAMRALYDAQGRLEHFVDDTPPGRYLVPLAEVDGQLFGTNEEGIFVRDEGRWRSILPG
ncbi:MAG TPA: hypothetical protein VEQ65_00335, partial [Opitutus sp.]|nr:hypothetical protein [Opitutus sp.]